MLFVGLTLDGKDQLEQIQAYLNEFEIPWLTGYGAMEALQALGVQAFPTKIVVGADGRIAWHDELGGSLDAAIRQALAGAA